MEPIVENSIQHGIPEEMLSKILSGDIDSKRGSGYGLKNIDQRIKLYYGEKYGLSFESELGHGTSVIIKKPAVIKST